MRFLPRETASWIRPGRSWTIAVGLVALAVLSGCAGKTSAPTATGGVQVVKPTDAPVAIDPNCPGCAPAEAGKVDPKRHFHHYWGDKTEIVIFDAKLTFKPNVADRAKQGQPPEFTTTDFTNNFDQRCFSVGYRQWTLEDYKSGPEGDVGGDQKAPINPDTGRADSVFAGTDYLKVELVDLDFANDQVDSEVIGVGFKYKPSNLNYFLPEDGCGGKLKLGQPAIIPVSQGQADPPHQYYSSRWEFAAYSLRNQAIPDQPETYEVPSVGQGQFHIRITMHNGGENFLDPAHPDLYTAGAVYKLGCSTELKVDRQIVLPPAMPARGTLTDMKWIEPRIVPLQTGKVVVNLKVKDDGSSPGTTWQLWYHGSNTTKFSQAQKVSGTPEDGVYEIPDPDGVLADPPYEFETLWRFELRPVGPNNGPSVFSATFKLCAEAHRDASAPPLT